MAENREQGIQHLTRLDLDISGIAASLEEASKQFDYWSAELGKKSKISLSDVFLGGSADGQSASMNKFSDSYVRGMEKAKTSTVELQDKIKELSKFGRETDVVAQALKNFSPTNGEDLQNLKSMLESLKAQVEASERTVKSINLSMDETTKSLQAQVEYTTKQNETFKEYYKSVQQANSEESKFVRDRTAVKVDYAAQAKQQKEEEEKAAQASRNLIASVIDFEIQKRKENSEDFSNRLKRKLEEEQQNAQDTRNLIASLYDFEIEKQKVSGEKFSAQLKEEMQNQRQEQIEIDKTAKALTALADKYDNLEISAKRYGQSDIAQTAQTTSASIKTLVASLGQEGVAVDEVKSKLNEYARVFVELNKQQKNQKSIQDTAKQLNNLADSYDALAAKAKKFGKDSIAETATKASGEIRKMAESVKSQEIAVDEAKQSLDEYGRSLSTLKQNFNESGGAVESFLKRFKDKVQWMSAYQLVNQLAKAFKDSIAVIKETEDAVIELKRVLSEDISANVMSDALYETAYEYGRTFEEVSEVATKFAQAGYDWNSVMEMTRGTMLALNTAELDVTQSTQGLIAIMSQWNLTAADFESIIDKINTTADDFPVTSEKIVAALQRASSSAKNANITFEETIGIITAMAKSTGRSGENIGTALNSLIIYTTKASSLETFAGLSDEMDKVVQKYKTGAASIFEVWQQLSTDIGKLSAQQQEALLKMTDYEQFANELESQATEYTDKIKETYQTAGSYRQNYFIALLQDMDTAKAAIENMADAEGYSAAENTKYMESLTANYNQLKVAVQELAVQLGEAGLLDFLKWLTQTATGVAKLTKELGGVHMVITAVGSALIIIKAQKIGNYISEIVSSLKSTITTMISVRAGITAVDTAEKGVIATNTAVQASFGWIGIVGLALSALVMTINGINSAMDELNAKARESALAQTDEAKSIQSLKEEYASIVNMTGDVGAKTDALNQFKDKLLKKYRDEEEAIRSLNGARADEIDFLDEEYERNIRNAYIDIRSQYGMAVDALTNQSQTAHFFAKGNLTQNDKDIIENILGTSMNYAGSRFDSLRFGIDFGTKDLQEQVNLLYEILDQEDLSKNAEEAINKLLAEKKELLEENNAIYKEYAETVAMRYLLEDELQDKIKEAADAENLEDRKRLYEDIVEQIKETVVGEEAQAIAIEIVANQLGIVAEKVDDVGEASERVWGSIKDDIAAAAESIEGFNAAIDSFQSGYDAVLAAMEEFNEYGYLSLDTIQQFVALGPDYVSLLNITANGVSLNKDKLAELIDKQKENVQSMIQQTTYAGLLEIAEKYLAEATDDVGDSANAGITPASQFGAALLQLAEDCLQVEYSAERAGAAIRSMFSDSSISPSNLSRMQGEMLDYIDTMRGVMNAVNSFTYESPAWSKGAQTVANNAAKAAEKAQKEQTAALKKELEAQKKAIKERYDAEIAALKEVQSENDRLAKQEEYYRKRREMLNNIEKYATRSGVEYREKEAEERQRLAELDSDWQQTLQKWSIDDQIKELERLRDAEIAAIDAQIEKITEAAATAISGIADTYAATNQSMLDGYRNNYLTPIIDDSEKAFENISDRLLDINKETAKKILDVYGENFIGPMEFEFTAMGKKIQELSAAASAFIGPVQQSVADLKNMEFRVSLNNRQAGASTYNNSTSNTYANIYSNSSRASSPSSSLFLKP